MKENPLVSVIVPNYNYARFLNQRLDSILNQTYQNFELIILDDCSTDNCREIIENYRENPHVTHIVYNEENSGSTFKQWKKGIGLAKGELVWIAESDDYSSPYFLETLIPTFLENQKTGIVYSASQYVNGMGEYIYTNHDDSIDHVYYSGKKFIKSKLSKDSQVKNASAALFRLEYYKRISSFKWEDMKAVGDRMFWVLLSEISDVVYVNKKLNFFRVNSGANKVSPRRFRDGTNLIESKIIDDYLVEKKYLRGWNRLSTLCTRLNQIYYSDFDSLNIKSSLLKLYNYNGLISFPVFKFFSLLCVLHNRIFK